MYIYKTSHQHCTKWGKTKSIFPKIKNEYPFSSFSFNTVFEILANAIRQDKEIKEMQTAMEEVKVPLFTDDTIWNLKALKFYQNTLRSDKHVKPSSRAQNQNIKINIMHVVNREPRKQSHPK